MSVTPQQHIETVCSPQGLLAAQIWAVIGKPEFGVLENYEILKATLELAKLVIAKENAQ